MPFKAATYNVLANAYIRPDRYPEVPSELLRPDRRIPGLARHVEQLDADLLCLQEVEDETFDILTQRLNSLDYDGRFEKKGQNKPDGAATFFRRSRFTLREEPQDEGERAVIARDRIQVPSARVRGEPLPRRQRRASRRYRGVDIGR